MPEQFDRISDYARQTAVLPDAESLRARGTARRRRRLMAQSTGGVGAVVGVALLAVSVSGGRAPISTGGVQGLPAGSVYVCPMRTSGGVVTLQRATAPGGGKVDAMPSDCHAVTDATGAGDGTGLASPNPPPASVDLNSPGPIPSGPQWAMVTSTSKLPANATLTLELQDASYFLQVTVPGSKEAVVYTLGYDGPAQVMPFLEQLGFKHMTEIVMTDVCQYIDGQPHKVMDVRDAEGHSVLGHQVTVNERLTFVDAPGAEDFPSLDAHGSLNLPASCATTPTTSDSGD